MTVHRLPLWGPNALPDTRGNAFFEPYPVKATNDTWKHLVGVYNDTASLESIYDSFDVPKGYVGSAQFGVIWTATAITGAAVWNVNYRVVSGDNAVSLDQSTVQESLFVIDAAPSSIHNRLEVLIPASATNFVADGTVEYFLSRDGTITTSDTMAAAGIVVRPFFQYSDV